MKKRKQGSRDKAYRDLTSVSIIEALRKKEVESKSRLVKCYGRKVT